uniref:Uncharacterized protein n=1 Tax=Eutreptiella gymnastica TaxID=73025 RepID=A0A7S1JF86_9EUGL
MDTGAKLFESFAGHGFFLQLQLQFCMFWGVKMSCFESMNVASLGHVKDMPHQYNSVLTGMQPSKHEHTHWTCFYYVRKIFCMLQRFLQVVCSCFAGNFCS